MGRKTLTCDFRPVGEHACGAPADNVGVDEETLECVAVVCEQHARELATDTHMARTQWFVKEKR